MAINFNQIDIFYNFVNTYFDDDNNKKTTENYNL